MSGVMIIVIAWTLVFDSFTIVVYFQTITIVATTNISSYYYCFLYFYYLTFDYISHYLHLMSTYLSSITIIANTAVTTTIVKSYSKFHF